MKKMLIAVGLSILLGGCGLKSYTYYKPMGPGTYYRGPCGGPYDELVLNIANGVTVSISPIFADGTERFEVSGYIGVRGTHTLQFLSPVFVVESGGERKEIVISEVIGITGLQKKTSYPIGPPIEAVSSPYSFDLPLGDIDWKRFSLTFPRILIDSQEVVIPNVRFEYGKRKHMLFVCA